MIKCLILSCALIIPLEIQSPGQVLIQKFEGLMLCEYKDAAGLPTIGYGHLIKKGEVFTRCITPREAHQMLLADLHDTNLCLRKKVKEEKVNQNQVDALGSFTFNLGCGNLGKSTLLAKVNRGEPAGAEFLRWTKAGGKWFRGLYLRRLAEKELFERAA